MRTVDIGIGHDDDLVIPQFCNIKIVAVTFRKSAAERIDHGLDLGIRQDLVDAGLLYVQRLTADRQDCLVFTVSCSLGAAACGITLDDKDLALGCVPGSAVCQFSVGIEGILLLCKEVGLCLLLCLADLCRLLSAGYDALELLKIAVKIADGNLPGELFPEKTNEITTVIYQKDAAMMLEMLYGNV